MKIAITGGTGFVGRHLARALTAEGHQVVLIARGVDKRELSVRSGNLITFAAIGTSDEEKLRAAFKECQAVAHCAGINRELQAGDYERVHVQGTRNVVNAAKKAGVKKIVLVSFFGARPDCRSGYHESKFAAEEIVRGSGLDYTILKSGMIYGQGDHMLDHLSHVFHSFPLFAMVGFQKRYASPLAIEDLVRIMKAALTEERLSKETLAILGPDRITLQEAVERVANVVGRKPIIFPMPLFFHYGLATLLEAAMTIPLVSVAQVQILSEGFEEPYGNCQPLPNDLVPTTMFTPEQIRKGLPEPGPFSLKDLRCLSRDT
ncbi:MAG: nucleoside-diphosphate sugar epimerase [Candidatus Melainabacteria bacterium]|nr:MAG: nucleoside-diphosphate sugar epimerase [Candidatus Melainabacteria bacterium]